MSKILDSGARRDFETGAVRDIAEGKGRCDLLPLDVVSSILGRVNEEYDDVLYQIDMYIYMGDPDRLRKALYSFAMHKGVHIITLILDASKQYEKGAKKYAERNWEKGIPLHSYIDSAVRHYLKFLRGDDDENHDHAFVWNILGALRTQKDIPELNDLPFADKCVKKEGPQE